MGEFRAAVEVIGDRSAREAEIATILMEIGTRFGAHPDETTKQIIDRAAAAGDRVAMAFLIESPDGATNDELGALLVQRIREAKKETSDNVVPIMRGGKKR